MPLSPETAAGKRGLRIGNTRNASFLAPWFSEAGKLGLLPILGSPSETSILRPRYPEGGDPEPPGEPEGAEAKRQGRASSEDVDAWQWEMVKG